MFSRSIFGNNAGFINNLHGRSLRNNNLKNDGPQEKAFKLNQNGFVNVSLASQETTIETLASDIDEIFSNPKQHLDKIVNAGGKNFEDNHVVLKNPLKIFPDIGKLFTEEILDLLNGYYRNGAKIKHVRVWRNYGADVDSESANLFSNQWHNDQFDTSRIKLFVYLSPVVDEKTGATQMMNKSNSQKIMRSFGYFRRSWVLPHTKKLMENKSFKEILKGKRGDAFFLNATELLHRAGVPNLGHHRDIIQIEFEGANNPLPIQAQLSKLQNEADQDNYID